VSCLASVRASPLPTAASHVPAKGPSAIVISVFAKHGPPGLVAIALAIAGYFLFSLQDAAVKWLVTDHTVWEVLFVRSITITILCLAQGRGALVRQIVVSGNKGALLWRGAVILGAWLCYYRAARSLQLAELVTIYFAAPLMVTALSVLLLKEHVRWQRWAATGVGFVGVIIACQPGGAVSALPIVLTLSAALLWAYSNILVRQISPFETTIMQMLFSNAAFVVACGVTLPWTWSGSTPGALLLMVGIGFAGAAAQYLLLEGFRLAPASLIAPFEYTSLLWAFGLSYLVWRDVPGLPVFVGAALIMASGVAVVAGEWRAGRRRAIESSGSS
jgi:drug/metabolite transporter (DMT)-like permease